MLGSKGEFRRYERTGIRVPIALAPVGAEQTSTLQASTIDVSEGGFGLDREDAPLLRPGTRLSLQIDGLEGREVRGIVVHVGADQVGVRLDRERLSPLDIESIIGAAPWGERVKVRLRRQLWTQSRRLAVLLANTLLRPLLLAAVRPRFLFAVYGTERDIRTYYTPLMSRLMPSILIGGLIRHEGARGLLVASHHLESELSQDSARVVEYLDRLRQDFPRVQKVALVGRLPNFALKAGIPIESPFVDGSMGTRYMIWDVAQQMSQRPEYQNESTIIVLGGAGRIGNLVCEDLLRVFTRVIAFDPRYLDDEEIRREKGTILRTCNRAALSRSRLLIALTHHGDVIRELRDFMEPGSLIADDTHPCISTGVREYLADRGIRTQKIVLSHEAFRMWPRMPAWNSRDIPGCLVESLVLLEHETEVAEEFGHFMSTAREMGFRGRLIPPPED